MIAPQTPTGLADRLLRADDALQKFHDYLCAYLTCKTRRYRGSPLSNIFLLDFDLIRSICPSDGINEMPDGADATVLGPLRTSRAVRLLRQTSSHYCLPLGTLREISSRVLHLRSGSTAEANALVDGLLAIQKGRRTWPDLTEHYGVMLGDSLQRTLKALSCDRSELRALSDVVSSDANVGLEALTPRFDESFSRAYQVMLGELALKRRDASRNNDADALNFASAVSVIRSLEDATLSRSRRRIEAPMPILISNTKMLRRSNPLDYTNRAFRNALEADGSKGDELFPLDSSFFILHELLATHFEENDQLTIDWARSMKSTVERAQRAYQDIHKDVTRRSGKKGSWPPPDEEFPRHLVLDFQTKTAACRDVIVELLSHELAAEHADATNEIWTRDVATRVSHALNARALESVLSELRWLKGKLEERPFTEGLDRLDTIIVDSEQHPYVIDRRTPTASLRGDLVLPDNGTVPGLLKSLRYVALAPHSNAVRLALDRTGAVGKPTLTIIWQHDSLDIQQLFDIGLEFLADIDNELIADSLEIIVYAGGQRHTLSSSNVSPISQIEHVIAEVLQMPDYLVVRSGNVSFHADLAAFDPSNPEFQCAAKLNADAMKPFVQHLIARAVALTSRGSMSESLVQRLISRLIEELSSDKLAA